MERTEVDSSNIIAIGYDPNSKILEVEFGKEGPEVSTNRIYQYQDVPRDIYEAFLEDESPGGYLGTYIRKEFPYQFMGNLEDLENTG